MKKVILKISGEALSGEKAISMDKVTLMAKEIKQLQAQGDISIGIVCGAGNIWRGRDAIVNGMDRVNADYMGMISTVLNCFALQAALKNIGVKTKVLSAIDMPKIVESYTKEKAESYFEKGYICIFGGGTGSPYFSTDTAASLRAAELNCDLILMAKNGTDGVYNKDPRKFKDGKKYTKMTHQEIIDKNLGIMDLTAATMCMENNIDIVVFDMNIKGNIAKAVVNYDIGTLVTRK